MTKCTNGRCGHPKMSGYGRCKRCEIANIDYQRRRKNLRLSGHLYVALTPCGLKVGRSCEPDRRMGELKRKWFSNVDCGIKLLEVYEDKGHLEPFIHFELNGYRMPGYREVFDCDLETVYATIDSVFAEYLLSAVG